jgi:PAS domain S-box-containing protein
MKNPLSILRRFVRNLGLVEQAQVVASTGVIVSMATIIIAMLATGQSPRLMDFVSILTIGLIGFAGVFFSLQYSRQLDEQRRQLLAINSIAESVNRVVELDHVLKTALKKVTELLNTNFGWVYMLEGNSLVLKSSKGTTADFLALNKDAAPDSPSAWLHQPRVQRERIAERLGLIHPELKLLGIQFWASIPLRAKESVGGTLIVAGEAYDMFTTKQAELMEAFGNQISVALSNAQLFERLKQSEQQYIDLFENAPDIYLSVNRHHTIVGFNKTGADILGYSKQETLRKPFENLFVEGRRVPVKDILTTMFSEGRGLKDAEEQMLRKDGTPIYVTLNSTLVFDDAGRTVNARIVARDISERKKMESAILHAQKIDSIGSLAGGIAHDFNNILASILGSASIMRRRISEKGKLYKYVEIIDNASRRGSALTRQLLTFARKTETEIKSVNVNAIIKETLQLFERSVTKEIRVVANLTGQSTSVRGDDGQIQQGLLNLFLNARDAMPNGGIMTVTTSVTQADAHVVRQFASVKPGTFIAVSVSDTGAGIAPEVQDRVFEPFFTTKDTGTGLGLSVLYGVVQNHGGFINLESEAGQGTTFTIYFPRAATGAQASARTRKQRLPRGRENVLVIDDEISVCEIAQDMLSDLGYSVTFVHDGRAGLDFYRTRQATIDLVLLDVNMPHMGGRQAFEGLKSINPATRIILLTGYGRDSIEAASLLAEANGFLQKPFQVEDLATKVRAVLDTRGVAVEATA